MKASKPVGYVQDGWAIWDKQSKSFVPKTNADTATEARRSMVEWLSNARGRQQRWNKISKEGYSCLRVYRLVPVRRAK